MDFICKSFVNLTMSIGSYERLQPSRYLDQFLGQLPLFYGMFENCCFTKCFVFSIQLR